VAVCKKYYAQKDKYGFPIPGTMEGFHKPYPSLKRGLFELKNFEYTPTPCECREYHPEGLRFFVKVDKYGNIIANSLFAARKKPLGVHTIEQIVYCEKFSCVIIPMKNFLNIDTPGYPVGVWNITGTYLGTATDQDAYVTLWNSDVTNQAQGTLFAGPTSTEFYITDTPNLTISFVRGLRYYRYTGAPGLQIFMGINDIVRYGSTTRTAANATAVQSDTRLEWNRPLWTINYFTKVPNKTVYVLTCTGNPDSTPVFIFHNEDTEYVGPKVFPPDGGVYTIFGALPIATQAFEARTDGNTFDYNAINNWPQLTSLWSICNFSAGGGRWHQTDPAKWPATINSTQITQVQIGQSLNNLISTAPYMTQANYPNVSELITDQNNSSVNFTGSESWFLNMPKVTKYLAIYSGAQTTATSDLVWNNVATNLTGVVPVVGSQKQLRIRNTSAASAASLVSRTYLAAQGWTVTLN
jgi:hypothetical protein